MSARAGFAVKGVETGEYGALVSLSLSVSVSLALSRFLCYEGA